jgi:hypothetical protein
MTGYRPDPPARGPRPSARPWGQPGPARPAVSRDHPAGAGGDDRLTAATGAALPWVGFHHTG